MHDPRPAPDQLATDTVEAILKGEHGPDVTLVQDPAGITRVEDAREDLVACLSADFPTRNGAAPLSQVLVRLAQSLARSFLDRKMKLDFPSRPLPDEIGEAENA